jgi:DNA-binding transcriptional MerR regulator
VKIGDLAKRAGINIQSIRFYERERLLKQPARTASGYRSYDEHDLEHVVFIKQCQHLGFTLKEIKELADLHSSVMVIRSGDATVASKLERIMAIAGERLQTIDEKICALQQMRARLLDGTRALARGQCPAPKPYKAS